MYYVWMIFLGVSSGDAGYRPLANYAKANAAFFTEVFGLKHGVPSHVTFREVLTNLDKKAIKKSFADWCSSQELSLFAVELKQSFPVLRGV